MGGRSDTIGARAGAYAEGWDIERLKAAGLSNRQVAREVGVAEGTVRNQTAAQNGKPSVSAHPFEADPEDPRQVGIEDVPPAAIETWNHLAGLLQRQASAIAAPPAGP